MVMVVMMTMSVQPIVGSMASYSCKTLIMFSYQTSSQSKFIFAWVPKGNNSSTSFPFYILEGAHANSTCCSRWGKKTNFVGPQQLGDQRICFQIMFYVYDSKLCLYVYYCFLTTTKQIWNIVVGRWEFSLYLATRGRSSSTNSEAVSKFFFCCHI